MCSLLLLRLVQLEALFLTAVLYEPIRGLQTENYINTRRCFIVLCYCSVVVIPDILHS